MAAQKALEACESNSVSNVEFSVEEEPLPRVNNYGSVVSLIFGSKQFEIFHLS